MIQLLVTLVVLRLDDIGTGFSIVLAPDVLPTTSSSQLHDRPTRSDSGGIRMEGPEINYVGGNERIPAIKQWPSKFNDVVMISLALCRPKSINPKCCIVLK